MQKSCLMWRGCDEPRARCPERPEGSDCHPRVSESQQGAAVLRQPLSHWSSPSTVPCLKASETLLPMRWPQQATLQVVVTVTYAVWSLEAAGNERVGDICDLP